VFILDCSEIASSFECFVLVFSPCMFVRIDAKVTNGGGALNMDNNKKVGE
jgi:hypothetical protein